MGRSLRIARLFGIPVYLHWTFGLIFVYIIFLGRWRGWGNGQIAESIVLALALFACVVLHELGHALTARRFGIQTRDIILSPIGGIARLHRLPDKPMQEVLVALAGPLVNIGLILLLSPGLLLHTTSEWRSHILSMDPNQSNYLISEVGPLGTFLLSLMLLNAMLAVFNLIPAFPMDGGRVLRALLSIKVGRLKATRLAAYVGQTLAILLLIYGLTAESASYTLIFIGIFVFVMAAMEFQMVRMDAALANYAVADVMRTNFTRIYAADTLSHILQLAPVHSEESFVVLDEWQNIRGTITRGQIARALKESPHKANTMLRAQVQTDYTPLSPEDSLLQVLYLIQDKDEHVFPVLDGQQLIGIVDYYMVYRLLQQQREPLRQRLERLPSPFRKRRASTAKESSVSN